MPRIFPPRTGLPALAFGVLLLPGCVTPTPPPVTRDFDGEYMYTIALTRVLPGRDCSSPSNSVRSAEIRNGQFALMYNAVQNTVLVGPVAGDGTIRAEGQLVSGLVRFEGRIVDRRLSGVATSPNCVYTVSAP